MSDTAAPVRELVIPQNADLDRTWKDENEDGTFVDYTGWEARGQVRTGFGGEMILDLAAYLTIDGEEIQLHVPESVNETLDFDAGFWDLLLDGPDGEVVRFLQGPAKLDRGVTT